MRQTKLDLRNFATSTSNDQNEQVERERALNERLKQLKKELADEHMNDLMKKFW